MNTGPIFTRATFQFFNDLARHNRVTWMDENRDRYRACIVEPFRSLLDELAPQVLQLHPGFDTCGRTGVNFSRINRDTRFAKDKTPYRSQMYLKLCVPFVGKAETGQLYVGLTADTVTAGFRIYSGSKRKESALARIGMPRVFADPRWPAKQKTRLARRYESYWYTTEKGEWTKHPGWPTTPEHWNRIQAWIVRRKLTRTAAMSASFPAEIGKIFRELFPLLRFTSLRD